MRPQAARSGEKAKLACLVTVAAAGLVLLCVITAGVGPWSRAGATASGGPAAAAAAARGAAMSTAAAAAAGGSTGAAAADTGLIVVYVTAPSPEVAESLASALVGQQLVACVNILPGVTSVYRWKGKVEKDPEVFMVMKTTAALLEPLTAKVKELHPYDEPEVIALPVVGGSDTYMAWVRDSTGGGGGGGA